MRIDASAPRGFLRLRTYVTCVERASHSRILGSLHDGAAIGEYGHLIRRDAEAQQEFVVADFRGRSLGHTAAELGKVERAAAFVNLYRVAAAEADVRLGASFEIRKAAAHAGAALRIASHANRLEFAVPHVAGDQFPVQR